MATQSVGSYLWSEAAVSRAGAKSYTIVTADVVFGSNETADNEQFTATTTGSMNIHGSSAAGSFTLTWTAKGSSVGSNDVFLFWKTGSEMKTIMDGFKGTVSIDSVDDFELSTNGEQFTAGYKADGTIGFWQIIGKQGSAGDAVPLAGGSVAAAGKMTISFAGQVIVS